MGLRTRTAAELKALTASNYAALLNAETRAWIAEDPQNRGAGLLVEDKAHWERYAITTGLQLEVYLLRADFSDTYKSVHGVRPRHINVLALTLEELRAEMDALSDELKETRDEELQSSFDQANT